MYKKIIFILLIFQLYVLLGQSTYKVSKDGSGNFTSISQVNSANLIPGDVVSFNAGEQFSDAILNCKDGVTYNSYGNGKATLGNPSNTAFSHSIIIENKSNVSISNLKIFGTGKSGRGESDAIRIKSNLLSPGAGNKINILINNCIIRGGNNSTIGISSAIFSNGGINGLKILNNEISYFGIGIKVVNPYNVVIDGNEIHHVYYADPPNGIFTTNLVTRGGVGVELYGNSTVSSGENGWDANYTVIASNNKIHDFETSPFVTTTISKMIIEYNEVYDNLDERIYHGGIDHPHGLGKLDDLEFGDINYPGTYGTIVRYNKIHNFGRHQTSAKYEAHDGFRFTFNGVDYEADGSVYLYKNYPQDPEYSPYSIGVVIDGSGLGLKIYGNLMYDISTAAIIRTTKAGTDYRTAPYTNEIYNNTFWNVGSDPLYSEDYAGARVVGIVNYISSSIVKNNIFYLNNNFGSAIYCGSTNLQEGNNIIINNSGIRTDLKGGENSLSPAIAIFVSNSSGGTYNQVGDPSTFGYDISKANDLFVDVSNKDFRLRPGSIAIDKGADLGNSIDGQKIAGKGYTSGKVDIGAFEYGTEIDNGDSSTDDKTTHSSPVIISNPKNISTNLGNTITFTVAATSDDPIGYQWWKSPFVSESGSKIVSNSKYSGSTTNSLTINNVTSGDASVKYLCEVYNTKDPSNLWVNSSPASIELTIDNSSEEVILNTGLKVYLEAAYQNNSMKTSLNDSKILPLTQPYNTPPWNLDHNGQISEVKSNYVDWVLVELRSDLTNTKYRKSAILTTDGTVLNPDGTEFSFINITSNSYYLVISHRNHLSVMSSRKVDVTKEKKINYDFTTSMNSAYGSNSLVDLGNGDFGMIAGDADANGVINNLDFGVVANNIPFKGYADGDLDMNGIINVLDYTFINTNILKASNVPN